MPDQVVPDLSEHVFRAPLTLGPGALRDALEKLGERSDPEELQAFVQMFWCRPQAQPSGDPVRIIRIVGSLFRGFFDDYDMIRQNVDAAIDDPNVRGIILDIHSPGGQVSGLTDLGEHLLSLRKRGKPIWALANDQAASAAYWIASAAHKVFSTDAGVVGSIGALVVHVDQSKFDQERGVKFNEIASGARKTDLSSHKPLNPSGRSFLQGLVNRTAGLFFDHVAQARKMDAADVQAQEAALYIGEEGRKAGLIDGIATLDELVGRMEKTFAAAPRFGIAIQQGPTLMAQIGDTTMSEEKETSPEPTANPNAQELKLTIQGPEPVTAAAPAPDPEKEKGAEVIDLDKARAEGEKAGAQKERDRMAEVNAICKLAQVGQLAAEFIEEGLDAKAAGERILKMRAEDDERLVTRNTAASGTAVGEGEVVSFDTRAIYQRWNNPQALAQSARKESQAS